METKEKNLEQDIELFGISLDFQENVVSLSTVFSIIN